MNLKFIVLFIAWAGISFSTPDLDAIRNDYRNASESEQGVENLFTTLIAIGKNDDAILVAYKGAIFTLKAKYAEGIKDKKVLFKEGRELLEYAVEKQPDNVEIRCIRLSVQENVPKITGYFKNKEEDKKRILDNYGSMKDSGAKAFVKGYVKISESFTEAEKLVF